MSTQRENVTELIWESSTKTDADPGGRLSRPASGALVGLVLGAVYTLVASTIDAALMRDVPIRLDWPAVWGAAALGGLSGAALGALTAWPEVGWKGVLAGAAGFVAWSFAESYLKLQAAAFLFLPLFVPLMMMSLPLAGLLRWGAGRQVQLQAESGWARWRAQVLLLALVLAVGGFAGSWSQMPASAQAAVRTVHRLLGRTFAAPTNAALPPALQAVPEVVDHADSPYQLQQQPVSGSDQVDVRVVFADGYAISCLVGAEASWLLCRPGDEALFGGERIDPNDQR